MRMKEKSSFTNLLTRRDLLFRIGGLGLCGMLGQGQMLSLISPAEQSKAAQSPAGPSVLSPEDDAFLDDLERRNFQYFWDQASPLTGLIRDRSNVTYNDNPIVASIAATGFGLTALCIADQRNYIPTADVRERVLATLRFLWKKMPTHRGFFYHFADINSGERVWDSEVSSVDT